MPAKIAIDVIPPNILWTGLLIELRHLTQTAAQKKAAGKKLANNPSLHARQARQSAFGARVAGRLLVSLCMLFALLLPANAPNARSGGNTLLILDASGSMWGRVEGRSKIETARDVVVDLLSANPPRQSLGLMSYGHRRKGDCRDIELLVPPAVNTARGIQDAVMSIKPRGKTPLSASVIEAARTLRSEERKATVILVSDGRETCNYDPCKVAKALEESGVDFTAHVIGFNVKDPIDLSQLRCMAENTGGQFVAANNGEELSQALQAVSDIFNPSATAEQPTAAGTPAQDELQAGTQSEGGDDLTEHTNRAGSGAAGNAAAASSAGEANNDGAQSGSYASARGDAGDVNDVDVDTRLAQSASGGNDQNSALDRGVIGGARVVRETDGLKNRGARDSAVNDQGAARHSDTRRQATESPRSQSTQSAIDQTPELIADRISNNGAVVEVPSSSPNALTTVVKLTHPADLYTLQVFTVRWTGAGAAEDLIAIALPDSAAEQWVAAVPVSSGKKLKLTAPEVPGEYEVRYLSAGKQIVEARKIMVRKAEATLLAPAEARSGRLVRIGWKGGTRDAKDSITISRKGSPTSSAINRRVIRAQSSVMLLMPSRAGDYELRYIQAGGNIIGTKPIVVK